MTEQIEKEQKAIFYDYEDFKLDSIQSTTYQEYVDMKSDSEYKNKQIAGMCNALGLPAISMKIFEAEVKSGKYEVDLAPRLKKEPVKAKPVIPPGTKILGTLDEDTGDFVEGYYDRKNNWVETERYKKGTFNPKDYGL